MFARAIPLSLPLGQDHLHSNINRRIGVRCAAKKDRMVNGMKDRTAGFAPFTLMKYSKRPEEFCQHSVEVTVKKSPRQCFEIWNDWDKIIDFLDLIGELGKDPSDPQSAVLVCYYRYGHHPTLQNVVYLEKTEMEKNKYIKFASKDGMPLRGIVEFQKVKTGTKINLRFEHPLPVVLLDYKVGVLGVETHLYSILNENMETFKGLAEGRLSFSEDKHDMESFWKRMEKIKEAYLSSKTISRQQDPSLSGVEKRLHPYAEQWPFSVPSKM